MTFNFPGYWGKEKTVLVGSLTVSAGATVAVAFGGPVVVKRLILTTVTALTTGNSKLVVGVRDGDDGNEVEHSAYTLIQSGSAPDDVSEILLGVPDTAADSSGSDGLDVFSATPVLLEVATNEELFITADSVPGAGAILIYAQVQELGWHTGAANTGTSVLLAREAL